MNEAQVGNAIVVSNTDGDVLYRKRKPTNLSKFTEQIKEMLVENARLGASQKSAAALAGIHPATLSKWLERGTEEEDGPFADFAVNFFQAQAEYKMQLLAKIREIGVGTNQWAALMTILERVYPEEFRKPNEGKNGVTVNVGILEQRVHEAKERGLVVYNGG